MEIDNVNILKRIALIEQSLYLFEQKINQRLNAIEKVLKISNDKNTLTNSIIYFRNPSKETLDGKKI